MKASEFMTKTVITCKQNQTVEEAAKLMVDKGLSAMPIVDDSGKLVGIVTESDFIGKEANVPHALASVKKLFGETFYFGDVEDIYLKIKKYPLSKVMTKNPTTVTPDTELTDIVNTMINKDLKRFPVLQGGKLVGIITRRDLLKAFSKLK